MSAKNSQLEVTVLSAESLKAASSLFSSRLRPYVVLSSAAAEPWQQHPHRTRVDEKGARNPTWHDTLRVPVDPSFLVSSGRKEDEDGGSSSVHVRVLSRGLVTGPTELGRCRIRPSDVLDGLRPPGAVRRLSYALRTARHGCRGQGYIHLAVRLVGPHIDRLMPPAFQRPPPAEPGWCRMAIGIPVAAATGWGQEGEALWRGC